MFLSINTPPKACLIFKYPSLVTSALTFATLAPLISLAKVAIVVPLSVTLVAVVSVVLLAALAWIVNVLPPVSGVAALILPVTSKIPVAYLRNIL